MRESRGSSPTLGRCVIQRPYSPEALPDLADRDVNGVPRDERAVPGLGHHLLVADRLAAVAQDVRRA